jgi:hypothetical protein
LTKSKLNPASGQAQQNRVAQSENTASAISKYKGRIIFVHDSKACQCTLERCEEARKTLKSEIFNNPNLESLFEIEEIDYSSDPVVAEGIFKKNGFALLPYVILTDTTGSILYKNDYEFNKEVFMESVHKVAETK